MRKQMNEEVLPDGKYFERIYITDIYCRWLQIFIIDVREF